MKLADVTFIEIEDVEAAHAASLAAFGGRDGVLGRELLISAVMAPRATWDEAPLYASLAEMAASIYGDEDPARIFYHAIPQRIRKVGNTYELQLHLPFVGKEDVDIKHREGELFVSVGPYKREISLPRVLNGKRVTKGRLEEGTLSVTFADRTP